MAAKTTGKKKAGSAKKAATKKPMGKKTPAKKTSTGKKTTTTKKAAPKKPATTAKKAPAKRAKKVSPAKTKTTPKKTPTKGTKKAASAKSKTATSRLATKAKSPVSKKKAISVRKAATVKMAPTKAKTTVKAKAPTKAAKGTKKPAAAKRTAARLKVAVKTTGAKRKKAPIRPPIHAYKGIRPYLFTSYAHKNMQEVFSVIKRLNKYRYRIWYDEGIEPGNEWPEVVGTAIVNCTQFLVFMSPHAAESRNVRNEINLAFNEHKDIIVVFLQPTNLTEGMRLQIGTVQFINKYALTDPDFFDKINKVLSNSLKN